MSPAANQSQSALLALPRELVVQILADVYCDDADDDLSSLANVGLTCRVLSQEVFTDQDTWHRIHHRKYDNPLYACAFPSPRSGYDWRKRVLDRDFVSRFLPDTKTDVWEDGTSLDEWKNIAPKVFRTILDVYLDLPALGEPSTNARLLTNWIKTEAFRFFYSHVGQHDENANHLAALFPNDVISIPKSDDILEQGAALENKPLPWNTVGKWAGHIACVVGNREVETVRVNRHLVDAATESLDTVRGPGILGLKRPTGLADTVIWDWAGVEGWWYTCASKCVGSLGYRHRASRIPGVFHVVPATKEEVEVVFARHPPVRASGSGEPMDPWAHLVLDLNNANPLLDPIFFHGTLRDNDKTLVYGVVHLTRQNPPELEWTFATVNPVPVNPVVRYLDEDRPHVCDDIVLYGIQVGGRLSARGVVGTYWYRDTEGSGRWASQPNLNEPILNEPNGAWFWKIEETDLNGELPPSPPNSNALQEDRWSPVTPEPLESPVFSPIPGSPSSGPPLDDTQGDAEYD